MRSLIALAARRSQEVTDRCYKTNGECTSFAFKKLPRRESREKGHGTLTMTQPLLDPIPSVIPSPLKKGGHSVPMAILIVDELEVPMHRGAVAFSTSTPPIGEGAIELSPILSKSTQQEEQPLVPSSNACRNGSHFTAVATSPSTTHTTSTTSMVFLTGWQITKNSAAIAGAIVETPKAANMHPKLHPYIYGGYSESNRLTLYSIGLNSSSRAGGEATRIGPFGYWCPFPSPAFCIAVSGHCHPLLEGPSHRLIADARASAARHKLNALGPPLPPCKPEPAQAARFRTSCSSQQHWMGWVMGNLATLSIAAPPAEEVSFAEIQNRLALRRLQEPRAVTLLSTLSCFTTALSVAFRSCEYPPVGYWIAEDAATFRIDNPFFREQGLYDPRRRIAVREYRPQLLKLSAYAVVDEEGLLTTLLGAGGPPGEHNIPLLDPDWPATRRVHRPVSVPTDTEPITFQDAEFAPGCLVMTERDCQCSHTNGQSCGPPSGKAPILEVAISMSLATAYASGWLKTPQSPRSRPTTIPQVLAHMIRTSMRP
ncbi:hypothetical protein BKA70DRAFT_1242641 [Coprinopsis sp. MPI-PUGE-AT-0042]|nr:hypothetical protein BKA70DRAFT_1242641 [Coprinopsis sp. MPI-PUGE-AT-0042]